MQQLNGPCTLIDALCSFPYYRKSILECDMAGYLETYTLIIPGKQDEGCMAKICDVMHPHGSAGRRKSITLTRR